MAEVPIRDAATAVVVRDGERDDDGVQVLLVRKGSGPQFHAGSWVFPGGATDAPDRDGPGGSDQWAVAGRTAARETREEAGLHLDPATFVPWSHWLTPAGGSRRFATWFVLAPVDRGVEPTVDGTEIVDYRWIAAGEAAAQQRGGELVLPAPQYVTVEGLCRYGSLADLLAAARASEPVWFAGRPHTDGDQLVLLYRPDAAYEGGPLDAPGARHRVLHVDGRWHYVRSD